MSFVPRTFDVAEWPPNYVSVFQWRQKTLLALRQSPELMKGALEFYSTRPKAFINHWCDTFDPRNAGKTGMLTRMPFVMFRRQDELLDFLLDCMRDQEGGLIEKCRDMGATWDCVNFSVWLWRFVPGAAVGWGSRKEDLVDKIGDPDSIFEKIRRVIEFLPREFWPKGYDPRKHASFMKVYNPETGAIISGEAGDNIGRGGRKSIYFKDESAHYERPELIEASLSENTRVQIDISSVNGVGNVFHRRRMNGVEWSPGKEIGKGYTRVFVMDWRDNPAHTQEWYDTKKFKAELDGLMHIFAQEIERNYSASVEGIIIPALWVRSAIDAHKKLIINPNAGKWFGGFDVADSGLDRNALALRRGITLRTVVEWGSVTTDPGESLRNIVLQRIGERPEIERIELMYDSVGIGVAVKTEHNRLIEDKKFPKNVSLVPWSAGAAVQNPYNRLLTKPNGDPDEASPMVGDFYKNLKAQAWWELRGRFYRTHMAITKGFKYDPETLISIDSTMMQLSTLERELSQAVTKKSTDLKLLVDKTPDGTKSPNLADAVVMAYYPLDSNPGTPAFGTSSQTTR